MDSANQTSPIFDTIDLPLLLLREEVAQLGRCSTRTVARAEVAGELPVAKPHRRGAERPLYRRGDVLRWLGLAESEEARP